jgi:hypothetical protein
MTRRPLLLLGLGLALVACGGGDTTESDTTGATVAATTTTTAAETTTSTTEATTTTATAASSGSHLASIRSAIANSAEMVSGRMEGTVEISGAGTAPTLDLFLPFSGAFDEATGNSMFSMDLSAMAEAAAASGEEVPPEFAEAFGEMEVRVVDGVSYIRFPFFGLMFGSETPWISAPADEGSDFASDFTFVRPDNPAGLLESLEDADGEVEEIGRETVNGVDTTHYRVVFDTAAAFAAATPEERAELEASGMVPEGEFPVDLWVSDEGWIVRYIMDVDGSSVSNPNGDEFERMVMTFNLLDINQPVQIEAPDPTEVTEMEGLASGFFGMPGG